MAAKFFEKGEEVIAFRTVTRTAPAQTWNEQTKRVESILYVYFIGEGRTTLRGSDTWEFRKLFKEYLQECG